MNTWNPSVFWRMGHRLKIWSLLARYQFQDAVNFKHHFWVLKMNLTVWWPLGLLEIFGRDIWYATRILGWMFGQDDELEPPSQAIRRRRYHFHAANSNVIRSKDYTIR